MKVALVRGPIVSTVRAFNNEAVPTIGLAYIHGYLQKKGHPCVLVDAIAEGLDKIWPVDSLPGYICQGLTFDEILQRIPQDADVVGFSAMFSGEWPIQRTLIARIKERIPKAIMVVGGEHITALTEYSLRDCPAIDYAVRGEGERTFAQLIDVLSAGGDPAEIPGVHFIGADGAYGGGGLALRIKDPDTIPWPHWQEGYLEKFWAARKSYGILTDRDMPMNVSRGCPFQCTFCSSPNMWTTRYVLRDPDDVVAEIKHYRDRYQITAIQLYDLTAITKKWWAVEFLNKLIAAGISLNWSLPSGTRSEALDDEVLALLKKTGCNYLVYAPESGSPATLARIKKRVDLDRLTQSAVSASRLGIVIRTNLIIGFPGETRADVFRTIRYGLYLSLRGADEVAINIFSPYPGTELFRHVLDSGRIRLGDPYFLSLTSLNSDYTSLNPLVVNECMRARELAFYRISFMLMNYIIGYVIRPRRILRTLRNLWSGESAATVFEHRLMDVIRRRKQA